MKNIENILVESLRKKMKSYNPETSSMPFHTRLLGKDRLALFSFVHSLNTNFGTSIFEPIALELSKNKFKITEKQKSCPNEISTQAQLVIQDIMDALNSVIIDPNKIEEITRIREVCQAGDIKKVKTTKVDIWLENDDEIVLFDLKTAKPNKGNFKEFKRTLLEWVACYLYQFPNANINTLIAIPYNPYAPKPYARWTMKGMLDLEHELKVEEEFWDFLGGKGTYLELLDIFEKVGLEMRDEIDEYFFKFNK